MAIDGKWSIVVQSPMGAQKAELELISDGNTLTGTQSVEQGSLPIANGKTDGKGAEWSVDIAQPLSLTLTFNAKTDGDAISGSVKAGAFGSFPFSGKRV
jgi:hypothetical protein